MTTKSRIVGLNPGLAGWVAAPRSGPNAAEAAVIVGTGRGWGWSQRSDCSPGPSGGRDAPRLMLPIGSPNPGPTGAGNEGVEGSVGDGRPGLVHQPEHIGQIVDTAQAPDGRLPNGQQVAQVATGPP